MPIYEYQCQECSHRFETMQRFSDAPLTDCPKCAHTSSLKKLLSAPAFRLKGGGWYETDFKSNNKRNLAEGDKGGGESGSSKPEATKTESKSDSSSSTGSDSSKAGGSTPASSD